MDDARVYRILPAVVMLELAERYSRTAMATAGDILVVATTVFMLLLVRWCLSLMRVDSRLELGFYEQNSDPKVEEVVFNFPLLHGQS